MPAKFETTLAKVDGIPNKANAALLREFLQYLRENGSSERHQHNQLKAMIPYALFAGKTSLLTVKRKEQITAFLDKRIKSEQEDPEKKWITTWNDYSNRLKFFFRWLHNQRGKEDIIPTSEWETPSFARIRHKKTKRLSPYSETEIWDLDELLSILPYERQKRNKAALTMFWDLDARNHEVTMLKIKNIRLRERYGEGSIPDEAKTGCGPILLTVSFPYVRDWLNEHPLRNDPEARIICNFRTGGPMQPENMWNMTHALKNRIARMLKAGEITDEKERQRLEYLLATKKWNPYCIRHSALTHDADYLPEFALRKKARWSMSSDQPKRYLKRKWSQDMKMTILSHNGIIDEKEARPRRQVLDCSRCRHVNALENKACSKCGYPLSQEALDEIKAEEQKRVRDLEEELKATREENDRRFKHVMWLIQQNPKLANVKPEELEKLKPESADNSGRAHT